MKAIVIYYSFEGNTKAAAKKAAEIIGSDLARIRTDGEPPKSGLKKFLVGGKQVIRGERPQIALPEINYDKYDVIILACPVWASSFPPAVGSYLDKLPFSGKKVYLIGCSASGHADKMFEKMEKGLYSNTVIGTLSLRDPLKHPEEMEKLEVLPKILDAEESNAD